MPKDAPYKFTVVPARRSNESTATRRARRIVLALLLAAVLGPVSVLLTMAARNSGNDSSYTEPEGRAVADAAVYQALSGTSVQMPLAASLDPTTLLPDQVQDLSKMLPYKAQSVTWIGFTDQTFRPNQDSSPTYFEIHHYLVVPEPGQTTTATDAAATPGTEPTQAAADDSASKVTTDQPADAASTPPSDDTATADADPAATDTTATDDGSAADDDEETGLSLVQIDVPVVLTDSGPRLAGAPSLSPWTGSFEGRVGTGDYTNYRQVQDLATQQTVDQVTKWAAAYATDDQAQLLVLTGDQDPDHYYVGLNGFKLADESDAIQILSAVPAYTTDDANILRVRVQLQSTTGETTATGEPFSTYSDFDLLVGEPDSAQPRILAWGPAGSAPSLEAYGNALSS